MREINGTLKMLGSGSTIKTQVGKSFVHYNSIEIGDTILQKVRTAQSLSDYIERGLGEPVTLFLNGKLLIGVRLANGKTYFWKRSLIGPVLGLLCTLPMFGGLMAASNSILVSVGVPALFYTLLFGSDLKQVLSYQARLSAMGGIPLKS